MVIYTSKKKFIRLCNYYYYYYFIDMMNDIGIDKKQQLYVIKKMIKIAIRATYYIFVVEIGIGIAQTKGNFSFFSFLVLLSFFCVCVFCVFFFNNPISSGICKLPMCSEIYNCTFQNTNKVSIISRAPTRVKRAWRSSIAKINW